MEERTERRWWWEDARFLELPLKKMGAKFLEDLEEMRKRVDLWWGADRTIGLLAQLVEHGQGDIQARAIQAVRDFTTRGKPLQPEWRDRPEWDGRGGNWTLIQLWTGDWLEGRACCPIGRWLTRAALVGSQKRNPRTRRPVDEKELLAQLTVLGEWSEAWMRKKGRWS